MVFAKGGEVLLDFRQKNFGDHPSNEDILKAAGVDSAKAPAADLNDVQPAAECDMICS